LQLFTVVLTFSGVFTFLGSCFVSCLLFFTSTYCENGPYPQTSTYLTLNSTFAKSPTCTT
jgi:hypothetical protein